MLFTENELLERSIIVMKAELLEAKKQIMILKKEKTAFVKELASSKGEVRQKNDEVNDLMAKMSDLKKENIKFKLMISKAEKDLMTVKKASENRLETEMKLNERITVLSKENQFMNSSEKQAKDNLNLLKTEIQKIKETEKKHLKEIETLKADFKSRKETEHKEFGEEMKFKDEEIKRLTITRKISVENGTKLHERNKSLEKELKELKEKKNSLIPLKDLPYPCDKCDRTFKTAGLLVKHVKNDHENLPACRP